MDAINAEYYGKLFFFCLKETSNYSDSDAFVSDLALSSVWEDSTDAELDPERIKWLQQIWSAAHRSIKDILKLIPMTQAAFSDCFGIPLRTVENWCSGKNDCPLYTNILIQERLGLVSRDYAIKAEKIIKLKHFYEEKKKVLSELGYEPDEAESWEDIINNNEEHSYLTENEVDGKHVLWYLDARTDIIYDLDEDRLLDKEEVQTFLKRFDVE